MPVDATIWVSPTDPTVGAEGLTVSGGAALSAVLAFAAVAHVVARVVTRSGSRPRVEPFPSWLPLVVPELVRPTPTTAEPAIRSEAPHPSPRRA